MQTRVHSDIPSNGPETNTSQTNDVQSTVFPCIHMNEGVAAVKGAPARWSRGGVRQGSLAGPEYFLQILDDLETPIDYVKHSDDTTLYELCNIHQLSKLQEAAIGVEQWAADNSSNLNPRKTTEPFNTLEGTILK